MNTEKQSGMSGKLNIQQESVFRLLCEEFDHAGAGTSLPSVRKVMTRFAVGQQSAQRILALLAHRYHVKIQERRKMRICNADGHADSEVVFCLMPIWRYEWEKIIDEFNSTHRLHILPKFINYTFEFRYALEIADVILFPRASFCLENAIGTENFIDLSPMISSLDVSKYYPATFQRGKKRRIWGCCPYLSTQVLCFDHHLHQIPVRQMDFEEFRDLLYFLKKTYPQQFLFPACISHYCEFLPRWGSSLSDASMENSDWASSSNLEQVLRYFHELYQDGLIPRSSELFQYRRDLELFFNQKIFLKNFSLFRLPALVGPVFDVLPMPLRKNGSHSIYSEIMCVPQSSRMKDGAWEFITFVLQRKAQELLCAQMKTMSVLRGMTPLYMKKKQARIFSDIFENGLSSPDLQGNLLKLTDEEFENMWLTDSRMQ